MTVKEIAKIVGKDPSTVSRWVHLASVKVQEIFCKVQEAKATSNPADYTLAETCQIIEEGLGQAAAGVYRTNAAMAKAKPTMGTRLPSGAQINAMCWVYGKTGAAERLDYIIGYKQQQARPEVVMIAANIGPISRPAYAVEMRERARLDAKAIQASLTPELFK